MNKRILSFLCHPDDTEFVTAGTLALLKSKGWEIHIATMTPGDVGSVELSREQISNVRRKEAANAAAVLNGHYHCNELEDVFVMYDKSSLLKTIELIRKVKPTMVFAPSPQDYFVDHEITAQLVRTACFICGVPNIDTPGVAPYDFIPHLYYADAIGGRDIFGDEIKTQLYFDITSVIDIKEKMLCCHKSQREWLIASQGMDEYVDFMKGSSAKRGSQVGCKYAEVFRQHLGHGYPQDNLLKEELSEFALKS